MLLSGKDLVSKARNRIVRREVSNGNQVRLTRLRPKPIDVAWHCQHPQHLTNVQDRRLPLLAYDHFFELASLIVRFYVVCHGIRREHSCQLDPNS